MSTGWRIPVQTAWGRLSAHALVLDFFKPKNAYEYVNSQASPRRLTGLEKREG